MLVGLAACGSAGDAGSGGGSGLEGPDQPLAFDRQVLYEVGGAEAEGWAAFGDIDDVGFDAAGNLYVLDSQASQIHVLSQDGTLLRSMGTPGQGPGELGQTRGMTVFEDGTVAVFDIMKFGLVVYGPDGEWVRDVRVDPSETGLLSPPFLPMPYETILARIGGRVRMGPPPDDEPEPEPGQPVLRVPLGEEAGDAQEILRTWEPPPVGGTGDETTLRSEGGGGAISLRMDRMRGFTPEVRMSAFPDGRILIVDSTTYRIRLYDEDGMLVRELARPIPPVQVTSSIQEKERARRLADLEESGTGGALRIVTLGGGGGGSMQAPDMTEMMRGRIEEMVFYPEIQVIERVAADRDGRIWVQRASSEPGEPGPTDVITPDGRYLGTVAPDGLRTPRAFGPNGLGVWVERDEYDAERVVVARITPSN